MRASEWRIASVCIDLNLGGYDVENVCCFVTARSDR